MYSKQTNNELRILKSGECQQPGLIGRASGTATTASGIDREIEGQTGRQKVAALLLYC